MDTETLIRILQSSITPAVLISGFGLLLLSMTNRLGRAIDRVRLLHREEPGCSPTQKRKIQEQIKLLLHRCHLLQGAIILIAVGIFLVSLTIFMLFSTFLFAVPLENFVQLAFATSLLCMIGSLFLFILDVQSTLHSVKLEVTVD